MAGAGTARRRHHSVQRGNVAGAAGVLARAADHLDDAVRPARHGIDVDGLILHARALIDDLALNNDIDAERLRPRLLAEKKLLLEAVAHAGFGQQVHGV